MKKDIIPPVVEDIAIAIIREMNEQNEMEWNAYLVNLKNEEIEGVLITSKGYGALNDEEVKTTTLRHFLDILPPRSFKKIEPVMDSVFGLNNEFWLSFYLHKVMYDKKYVFLPETIIEENFTLVPIINKKGVMIK